MESGTPVWGVVAGLKETSVPFVTSYRDVFKNCCFHAHRPNPKAGENEIPFVKGLFPTTGPLNSCFGCESVLKSRPRENHSQHGVGIIARAPEVARDGKAPTHL